ncbi:MAG TPA: DNA-directed RNA polymerase subunit omega [Pyrinomonadaceae bacterium]|jgi:DNA-directed RNA polymerase omega subunit
MLIGSNTLLEAEQVSPVKAKAMIRAASEEQWPGISSRYQLIVVASLRSKQLLRGARPRIDADPRKRRNTSIALEEAKRGLVPFTTTTGDQASMGVNDNELKREGL